MPGWSIWGGKCDWVTGPSLNDRPCDLGQVDLRALVVSCRSLSRDVMHKRLVDKSKSMGRKEMGS